MEETKTLSQRILKELLDLAKIFVICFVIVFILTHYVAKPIRVEGSSMYPTLQDGQLGITNVFAVKFQNVSRFDVVIVYNEERGEHWVKRVIGVPGDTVESKDDVLKINGKVIDQFFLNQTYVKDMQKEGNFTSI